MDGVIVKSGLFAEEDLYLSLQKKEDYRLIWHGCCLVRRRCDVLKKKKKEEVCDADDVPVYK